jgi:hypothetical protein
MNNRDVRERVDRNTQNPAMRLPVGPLGPATAAALWARSSRILLCPGAPFSKLMSLRRSAACVGSSYTACKPVLMPSSGAVFMFEVPFSGSSPNAHDVVYIFGVFAGGSFMQETFVPAFVPVPVGSCCMNVDINMRSHDERESNKGCYLP